MNEARPDALLKSALEKIVYFEARSEQLQNDLAGARAEIERLKHDLTDASQREIGLRRQAAEMEVTVTRAHRDKQELGARIEALLHERTTVLARLIDGARIRGEVGAPDDSGVDLASFISELRGEVLAAREQAQSKTSPGPPALALVAATAPVPRAMAGAATENSFTTLQAVRLRGEGRLEISEQEVLELSSQGKVGRSEQTLFGFSIRELSAPDAAARVRASERLRALGDPAAAPALAAALHGEPDPAVQVAFLGVFAALAQAEGAPIARALLTSPVADVRIAALKAVMQLEPGSAAPHLAAAVRDPDPSVRRRASLLALSLRGDEALRLSQETIHDPDPEVRRLTALALGAGGRAQSRAQLFEFLGDPDVRVRRAAGQSVGRLLGMDVSYLVNLDDAQRRREVRRLTSLPLRTVRPEEILSQRGPVTPGSAEPEPFKLPPPASLEPLCGALIADIRCALRGRALPELVVAAGAHEEDVQTACELLIARGQVVRRGLKYFTA